jgi:hypothetical protein
MPASASVRGACGTNGLLFASDIFSDMLEKTTATSRLLFVGVDIEVGSLLDTFSGVTSGLLSVWMS